MREIKFRAWDKRSEVYRYFTLTQPFDDEIDCYHSQLVLEGAEFEQYTGLHDSEGKEIYENDVVVAEWIPYTPNASDMGVRDKRYIGRVVWLDCGFGIANNGLSSVMDGWNWRYEVIGNRWENPELLDE